MPVTLCIQIVPFKSVSFEGASQILSAALIRQSDIFTLFEWLSFIRLQFAIWSVLKRDKEEMRLRNSPEAGWPFYPAYPEGSVLVVSKTFVLLNGSARNALFIMFLLGVFKLYDVQDASWIFVTLTKFLVREQTPHPTGVCHLHLCFHISWCSPTLLFWQASLLL